MDWLEVTVHVPAELVEPVADMLVEMGAGGVVIEDPAVLIEHAARTHPEEWAVPPLPVPAGRALVKAYFPEESSREKLLGALQLELSRIPAGCALEVDCRLLPRDDWATAWRAHYRTMRVGDKIVVKPAWEEYQAAAGEIVIEMDPGQAFGCGTHPTTAMCLRLMEKYLRGGEVIYDVGTGSGILAVAAARLGASRVVAVDVDPLAVRAARENAERNGVDGRVQVLRGNLLDAAEGSAGLVVANIIADVIITLAPAAASVLNPGGVFISSGIIAQRSGEVLAALGADGFAVEERVTEGEWVAFVARKI